MEQRLSMITLGVTDLDRSKQFYMDVVGWELAHSPEGIAFFDLGGLVLALYPHASLAGEVSAEAVDPVPDYHGFALAYNTRTKEEVDEIFASLRGHRADVVKQPEEVFWGGYSGYFKDPDGHLWEVAYNPYWSILADGRVSMGA